MSSRVDTALPSRAEALLRTRLDAFAHLGPQRVQTASHTVSKHPFERDATIFGIEPQVNLSPLVPHRVNTQEVASPSERVARENLHIVPKALGTVLVRVRATRAAPHAIVWRRSHAPVLSIRGRPVKVAP